MTRDESLARLGLPAAMTDRWQEQLAERTRHYHTQAHIDAMLARVEAWPRLAHDPPFRHWRELLAAIWLHDIVYDATRGDNEARSAEQARGDLAGTGIDVALVRRLILATRLHDATTAIGRHLCDLDLTILGAAHAVYDRYAQDIRREYAHVPEDAWRAGRPRVLRHFLARPRIYATAHFAHLETPARANLLREIAAIEG